MIPALPVCRIWLRLMLRQKYATASRHMGTCASACTKEEHASLLQAVSETQVDAACMLMT